MPATTQTQADEALPTTQASTQVLIPDSQESGYFIHKDPKEGFSVELPSNFLIKDNIPGREDLIFIANNKKGSQPYSIGVAVSVENTTQSESSILDNLSSSNVGDGFNVDKVYKAVKGSKTIGVIESSGVNPGTTKELSRVSALYVGNGKLYMVSSVTDKVGWETGKDMMTRIVSSFRLE